MKRLCTCERVRLGQPWDITQDCLLCWLFHHDEKYNRIQDGTGATKVQATSEEVKTDHISQSSDPPYNPYHQARPETTVVHFPPTEKAEKSAMEPARSANCVHLGEENGQIQCSACGGKVMVKTFACEVYGTCTIAKKLENTACCDGGRCPSYSLVAKLPDSDPKSGG